MRPPTLSKTSAINCKTLLHCKRYASKTSSDIALVFLHGFLGNSTDWQDIINKLSEVTHCYAIDLPGHGKSEHIFLDENNGFAQVDSLLQHTLKQHHIEKYILVGYSLGGRLAMYHASNQIKKHITGLCGLIIESSHYGLADEQLKDDRWLRDTHWAKRLEHAPLSQSISHWYKQGVFSSLSVAQKQQLIDSKQAICRRGVAHMLRSTSLAKQQYLIHDIEKISFPVYYLYGNKDDKYQQIAKQLKGYAGNVNLHGFDAAGHNVHFEQPKAFAKLIKNLYQTIAP